jgi:hypothetical protein
LSITRLYVLGTHWYVRFQDGNFTGHVPVAEANVSGPMVLAELRRRGYEVPVSVRAERP